jgi:hypothetical protein
MHTYVQREGEREARAHTHTDTHTHTPSQFSSGRKDPQARERDDNLHHMAREQQRLHGEYVLPHVCAYVSHASSMCLYAAHRECMLSDPST